MDEGQKEKRSAIATQILESRSLEQRGKVTTERDGFQYSIALGGIQSLFEYVKTLKSNLVLEIGAGDAGGLAEIARSIFGKGLRFKGTALRYREDIPQHLGKENVHITPVETLRGITDGSVGCVLAVYSVGYSTSPELAIKNIDRVLVAGGVFKGTFWPLNEKPSKLGLKNAQEFQTELEKRRYDVIRLERDDHSILIAIKPGYPSPFDAKRLLEEDLETAVEQGNQIKLTSK